VIIFAREPRIGTAKTRLANDVGLSEAWKFYRRNLRVIILRLINDKRWSVYLAVTPDSFHGKEPFLPEGLNIMHQGRGNIGTRMQRCLSAISPNPTLLVGSDIPDITPKLIWKAFGYLKGHDAVFGPTFDGGYWLVGLKPRILITKPFESVDWSSPDTLNETIDALPRGSNYATTDMLRDIDSGTSYKS
tara:strand:+ start:19055 stop:19621 length:567 start_codon:yes stop_codon:yes gene_type:complete